MHIRLSLIQITLTIPEQIFGINQNQPKTASRNYAARSSKPATNKSVTWKWVVICTSPTSTSTLAAHPSHQQLWQALWQHTPPIRKLINDSSKRIVQQMQAIGLESKFVFGIKKGSRLELLVDTMIHPTNETLLLKQLFSRKQDCETTFFSLPRTKKER